MADVTLRLVKGSPLTYQEVDDNFNNLNDSTGHFKNRIINGNFDIWQRGTSFSALSVPTYNADRWNSGSANGVGTVSRQAFTLGQTDVPGEPTYFLRHARTTAATSASNVVRQRVEGVRTFAGQTVTWSFYAKVASGTKSLTPVFVQVFGTGGAPSASVTLTASAITVTTSWQRFSVTVTLGSLSGKTVGTNNDDVLDITLNETASFGTFTLDFAQSQLEKGSQATEFEFRPFQTELALCQRYYYKTFPQTVTPAQSAGLPGTIHDVSDKDGSGNILAEFPVTMRATGTVTTFNPVVSNALARNFTTNSDVTAASSVLRSDRQSGVGFSAGASHAHSRVGIHITVDAEL